MPTTSSAATPAPPYYAVIFTSQRTSVDDGYGETSDKLVEQVEKQDGYMGYESFRNELGFGVTISYWRDLDSVKKWKQHHEHALAQREGRNQWYSHYKIRICKVERDYGFDGE